MYNFVEMKKLLTHLLLFLFLGLMINSSVSAETKWITKKNSKISKVETIEQLYVDGLLTRSECIKTKEKIFRGQSVPGCKIIETEEETVTYITKKKEGKYIIKKEETVTYITKKKEGKYITKKEKKKNNTKILLLIPLYLFI